jgi:hypothetical protein
MQALVVGTLVQALDIDLIALASQIPTQTAAVTAELGALDWHTYTHVHTHTHTHRQWIDEVLKSKCYHVCEVRVLFLFLFLFFVFRLIDWCTRVHYETRRLVTST